MKLVSRPYLYICFVCVLFGACPSSRAEPKADALLHDGHLVTVPERSPYRERIAVSEVVSVSLPHELTVPAVIEADPASSVPILAPLTGKIVDLKVRLGDRVRKGQVLATLQSSDLLQAGSDIKKARDAFSLARKSLERARQVFAEGGNAGKDVEAAESQFNQAKAELDRAEGRSLALGLQPDSDLSQPSLPLRATADGFVTIVNVGPGSLVNDLTAPLLNVVNLQNVFLTVLMPEAWLAQVKVGTPVTATVNAYPGQQIKAKVFSVAAIVDPDTRRTRVRCRVGNPGEWLRPNMFATAKLSVAQDPQPLLPQSALVMQNDRILVYVETKPWTFEGREVQLGTEDGDRVRIRSGVKAGERVVVRGGVLLND